MSDMHNPDLTYLLFKADEADIGIAVITSDPKRLRAKLYAARKTLCLNHLTFVQPPVESESRLWIIKKSARSGINEPTED